MCSFIGDNVDVKLRFLFDEAILKPKGNTSVNSQTWIRSKANSKGFFTLKNKATGKFLTLSSTSSGVTIAGTITNYRVSRIGTLNQWCRKVKNFLPKVSIKGPVPSQKKIDCTVLFTYLLTVSIKCPGLDIWKKSLLNNQ